MKETYSTNEDIEIILKDLEKGKIFKWWLSDMEKLLKKLELDTITELIGSQYREFLEGVLL